MLSRGWYWCLNPFVGRSSIPFSRIMKKKSRKVSSNGSSSSSSSSSTKEIILKNIKIYIY
jgi:hypothetical protein